MDNLRATSVRNNLYFDNTKDLVGGSINDKVDSQGFLVREAHNRRYYGVYTEKKSRASMITLLMSHMEEFKDKFVTKNITSDIMSLVRNKRGKIEASSGKHDDSIMSYLIALYVYYFGNNLYRYGFVKGQLPDENNMNKGMDYNDIINEMDDSTRQMFAPKDKTISDYNNNLQDEIRRARQMMDNSGMFNSGVEISNLDIVSDIDNSGGYSSGIDFDELND